MKLVATGKEGLRALEEGDADPDVSEEPPLIYASSFRLPAILTAFMTKENTKRFRKNSVVCKCSQNEVRRKSDGLTSEMSALLMAPVSFRRISIQQLGIENQNSCYHC